MRRFSYHSILAFAGVLALASIVLSGGLAADSGSEPWSRLEAGERGRVVEVIDGDTVLLDSGVEVRMVGIQAPKLPLGRKGFVPWPLANEARDALAALGSGRNVTLHYGGRRVDRHGRALAHLERDDGLWLQAAMLDRGLARVYSFRDNRAVVWDMLAIEREARASLRGIWAEPFYAIRAPGDAADHVDSFEIVEGRVLDVADVRGRTYLNFGPDWKTDFTVTIAPRDLETFEEADFDLGALRGRVVRVRGWLKSFNGPMIEATHPEQIEVFE